MSKILMFQFGWLLFLTSIQAVGDSINVDSGWIRLLPANIKTTVAYMEITNSGEELFKISGVKSTIADRGEIHRSYFKNGLMHMEKLDSIQIAPRSSVSMSSTGIHIMLIDLNTSVEEGQMHEVCLVAVDEAVLCERLEVLRSSPLSQETRHNH